RVRRPARRRRRTAARVVPLLRLGRRTGRGALDVLVRHDRGRRRRVRRRRARRPGGRMTRSADRVWTVPNAISVARLLLVPVFAWLIVAGHDLAALAVLAVAGFSDWLDGVIARRFDQSSRLGAMLDPAADRLYILVTLVMLAWREIVPWWLVVDRKSTRLN